MKPWFMHFEPPKTHGKDLPRTVGAQVARTSPEPASILRWEDDGGAAVERGYSGSFPAPEAARGH